MSNRAAEYRSLIEDVIAGGLLEDHEIAMLRDMLRRIERQIGAKLPVDMPQEFLETDDAR